jgi:hypothetical protein
MFLSGVVSGVMQCFTADIIQVGPLLVRRLGQATPAPAGAMQGLACSSQRNRQCNLV